MASFMRFFRGGGDEEEQQQQPSQQRQPQRPQQQQQQQRPRPPGQSPGRPASSSPGATSPSRGPGGTVPQKRTHHQQQQQQQQQKHKAGGATGAATTPSPGRPGGPGGNGKVGTPSSAGEPRKAPRTGDGHLSPLSATAMRQLEGYSDQLDGLEDEVSAIEAAVRDRRTPRARLLEAKDAIAQLNGSLEKLQFTGVDSVLTAELGEGKELAKEKRKSLNRRCDALRDRILKAGEALGRILATSL